MTSTGDPFLDSYLGVSAAPGGGAIMDNGLTLPTLATLDTSAIGASTTSSTPARGGCPSWFPAWACAAVNALPGSTQAAQVGNATGKAITGKDNATTNDVANVVPGYLQQTAFLLAGVLLLALGVWSIVKD